MKKEKTSPLSQDTDSVKQLESLKFVFRGPQNPLESGDHVTYEWLEDSVIRKVASVVFEKDTFGKDTATIKMKNPNTNKEEVVYYTTDTTEVARFKGISEGRTITVDLSEEDTET